MQRCATDHGDSFPPVCEEVVLNSFYVDDLLASVDTVADAEALVQNLPNLLMKGCFQLAKWTSNRPGVLSSLDPENLSTSQRARLTGDDVGANDEKALGLVWDTSSDYLTFATNMKPKPLTKRGLLSGLSSVFDPLGMASPYILKARVLVQELCRRGVGWDDPIPTDVHKGWKEWLKALDTIQYLTFPRCAVILACPSMQFQLCQFSDASSAAYGVATYLRVEDTSTGIVAVRLLQAKSRLAPLKRLTIPRLELQAAWLATQIDQQLVRELDIPLIPSHFWTDSTIVLQYIAHKTARFHTFVANRVHQIRKHADENHWSHVPTTMNPADLCSRGALPTTLSEELWQAGPEFLTESPEAWPKSPLPALPAADVEVKQEACVASELPALPPADVEVKQEVCVINPKLRETLQKHPLSRHFLLFADNWKKMVFHLSLLVHLAIYHVCKCRGTPRPGKDQRTPLLFELAESFMLRKIQEDSFPEELKALKKNRPFPKNTRLRKLDCYINLYGVMCVGGRLKHASIHERAKHPAILDSKHEWVKVLIRDTHAECAHMGAQVTLNRLQQRYWLVPGASAVKSELRKCVVCMRRNPVHIKCMMANLPPDRVLWDGTPFASTGIDYFGPFPASRIPGSTNHRDSAKMHVCLFTCMATRAVHLEGVDGCDTKTFMQALTRFICRRGTPKFFRSDNGRNFTAGCELLKKEFKVHQLRANQREPDGVRMRVALPAGPGPLHGWCLGTHGAKL